VRNKTWNDDGDESEQDEFESSDFDDDGYIPCPHCGETMLEDADYCPACERWITDGTTNKTRSPVWVMIVAAVLLGLLLTSVLRGF